MLLKNKTLGSALIIAGTAIGAGMLAMPLTSAGIGFGFTAALLIGLWLLLAYSGLLFVEVYQTAKRKDDGVATLTEKYFGIPGRIISTVSLFILLYALSAAYMTGGGEVLASALPENFFGEGDANLKASILIFTILLGAFVVIGTKGVDGITRLLFSGKILVFILVLAMMLPKIAPANLMEMPLDYALILSAGPVFFTSYGFHVVMGSINNYLDGDVKRFRMAIIIGTAIPLCAYLLWQLATHGIFSQNEFIAITNKIDTKWPHANILKTLLHPNTSLDDVFSNTCIPVLLTYDSSVLTRYDNKCDEYIQEISEEFQRFHKKFCDKLGEFPLTIHLFLFPLNTKAELINSLESKLKIWQSL